MKTCHLGISSQKINQHNAYGIYLSKIYIYIYMYTYIVYIYTIYVCMYRIYVREKVFNTCL